MHAVVIHCARQLLTINLQRKIVLNVCFQKLSILQKNVDYFIFFVCFISFLGCCADSVEAATIVRKSAL